MKLQSSNSEICNTKGKVPCTFQKKWSEVAERPMTMLSSNFPWNMKALLSENFNIEIKLKSYTSGADSQRWYEITIKE